jgi:hypothetical protein
MRAMTEDWGTALPKSTASDFEQCTLHTQADLCMGFHIFNTSSKQGGKPHLTGEDASLLTFYRPYDILGGSTLIIAL